MCARGNGSEDVEDIEALYSVLSANTTDNTKGQRTTASVADQEPRLLHYATMASCHRTNGATVPMCHDAETKTESEYERYAGSSFGSVVS